MLRAIMQTYGLPVPPHPPVGLLRLPTPHSPRLAWVSAKSGMASVFLGDLDDFIAPGQACINPLFTVPDAAPAAAAATAPAAAKTDGRRPGDAPMQLVLEDDGGPLNAMQVRRERGGKNSEENLVWSMMVTER